MNERVDGGSGGAGSGTMESVSERGKSEQAGAEGRNTGGFLTTLSDSQKHMVGSGTTTTETAAQ